MNKVPEIIEVSPLAVGGISLTEAFFSGRNASTMEAYRADLEDFRMYLESPDLRTAAQRLLAVSHGEANALALTYRSWLIDRGLSANTVNRRLSALRSLVKMANTFGLVPWRLDVPNLRAQAYRDTRGPGRRPFDEALKAVWQRGDAKGSRDAALLRLLHDLGLRRKEVIGLDLEDVDLDRGTLAIIGKGETQKQLLSLPDTTRAVLAGWIKIRGDHQGPLFPNFDRAGQGNGRLTGRGLLKICQKHGFRPHGLRHTAITEALDRTGGDVRAAQRFSRHRNIQTLLIYDDNRADIGGRVARMVAGDE